MDQDYCGDAELFKSFEKLKKMVTGGQFDEDIKQDMYESINSYIKNDWKVEENLIKYSRDRGIFEELYNTEGYDYEGWEKDWLMEYFYDCTRDRKLFDENLTLLAFRDDYVKIYMVGILLGPTKTKSKIRKQTEKDVDLITSHDIYKYIDRKGGNVNLIVHTASDTLD